MTKFSATVQQRALVGSCLDTGVPFFWLSPGTLLIKKSGLASVVPKVVAAGGKILGFEGFKLDGSDVCPQLDLIVDFERRRSGAEPLEAISDWPEDIWVDVAMA